MLHHGLYEQVINNALTSELAEIPEARKAVAPIDKAEASKVLAQYLADVVQKGLDNVLDNGGDLSAQIALTNQIVSLIQNTTKEADFAALGVDQRAEQLLALLREADPRLAVGKTAADLSRPETSIAQSSLFTGAIHEPQMYTELKKETVSADRIDMLVSFIKWSGLRLLMDELREFTQNGGELRIITTSYRTRTARYCRTKNLLRRSYRSLPIYDFLPDDLLRSGSDIVHPLHPCHRIGSLQALSNALCRFHLFDQRFHTHLSLLVKVSEICPKLPGED